MSTVNVNHDVYLITGIAHYISTSCLIILATTFHTKWFPVSVFNTKYGSRIAKLLFMIGIIQCSMSIIMMYNAYHIDHSHNLIFEGLALCQQASYHILLILIGGIYKEQQYDDNIKRIKLLLVCNVYMKYSFCIMLINTKKINIKQTLMTVICISNLIISLIPSLQEVQSKVYAGAYSIILAIGLISYGITIDVTRTSNPPITDPKLSKLFRNYSIVLVPLLVFYWWQIFVFLELVNNINRLVWLMWFRIIFANITLVAYFNLIFIAVFYYGL